MPDPALDLIPAPRRWDRGGVVDLGPVTVGVSGWDVPGAVEVLAEGLFRRGIDVVSGGGGWPVVMARSDTLPGEGYEIDARADGMTIAATSVPGLCRGAATARQLLSRKGPDGPDGPVERATGTVEDEPVVPLRMLAGWGLYRDHKLDDALEVATIGGYNRLLYNWWTAVPGERLPAGAGRMVERARSRGVELVCELRRQVLGPRFSLGDEVAVSRLLRLYDEAVDRGFRAFGLLFDDTDLDPFDDEIGLLETVVDHLCDRLGHQPEMWFCPRFYWFPGALDYSWLPRSVGPPGPGQVDLTPILGDAERRTPEETTARQVRYQERLAASLPPGTLVYLANWWGGTPEGWEPELARGWSDRLGAPAFWDNQQQNDYRLSNIVPAPLDHRPAAFAEALAGYALNTAVPLAAYGPASATAGAWAWNPHDYRPAEALAAALRELLGPDASGPAGEAIAAWRGLVAGLVEPDAGGQYHVTGLRRVAAEGRGDELRAAIAGADSLVVEARRLVPTRAPAMARELLDELGREPHRITLELELAETVEACTAGTLPADAARVRAGRLLGELSAHLARRLPPAPGLDDLLHAESLDLTRPSPGLSWFLHFHASAIQNGVAHLLAELEPQ